MNFNGSEIKIGRPKTYDTTMQAFKLNPGDSLRQLNNPGAPGTQPPDQNVAPTADEIEQEKLQKKLEDYHVKSFHKVPLPSRYLRLNGITTFETTHDLDDFKNLYSDIWDKCEEYGMVNSMKIPRPKFVDRTEQNKQEDLLKA